MSSDHRFDRFWVGMFSAILAFAGLYNLVLFLFGQVISDDYGYAVSDDPRPVLITAVLLVLAGRWLLVNRKWDHAGRGFFFVVIPAVLYFLYRSLRSANG